MMTCMDDFDVMDDGTVRAVLYLDAALVKAYAEKAERCEMSTAEVMSEALAAGCDNQGK